MVEPVLPVGDRDRQDDADEGADHRHAPEHEGVEVGVGGSKLLRHASSDGSAEDHQDEASDGSCGVVIQVVADDVADG